MRLVYFLFLILNFFSLSQTFSYTSSHPILKQVDIHLIPGYTAGKAVDHRHNFVTLEGLFFPALSHNHIQPFIDLRWHFEESQRKNACNLGAGVRYLAQDNLVLGGNIYYDWRQAVHGKTNFDQIGAGLEIFYKNWEFRSNIYYPIGTRKGSAYNIHKQTLSYDLTFTGFRGHTILIAERVLDVHQNRDRALFGTDLEIGRSLSLMKRLQLYTGLGAYYFSASGKTQIYGGSVRISSPITDFCSLELRASYDSFFHTNAQAVISFNFPLGKPIGVPNSDYCSSLLTPVNRNAMIVLIETKEHQIKHQRNFPINGDPSLGNNDRILFVNNKGRSNGNGTFERPFNSLIAAQDASQEGDIIYVFAGNGTSSGMDQGFFMKDNQRLLGSGLSHTLNSNQGMLYIPPQTTLFPLITNTRQNIGIIYLRNNCEVAGLHLTGNHGGDGIVGGDTNPLGPTHRGIQNTQIHNNIFNHINVRNGAIYLPNCQGSLIVTDNVITNITSTNCSSGIHLLNEIDNYYPESTIQSSILIANNLISGTNDQSIIIQHEYPSGSLNAFIKNNQIQQQSPLEAIFLGSRTTLAGGALCSTLIGNAMNTDLKINTAGRTSARVSLINNTLSGNNARISAVSRDNSQLHLYFENNHAGLGDDFSQLDSSILQLMDASISCP